jgi:small GTP-binding protein
MGLSITKLLNLSNLFGNKQAKLLMIGLDAAGKTSLLYKFKLNEHVATIPTIGFNVESIQYNNLTLNMHDVGGQSRIRCLWKHYYYDVNAIIFVIDSVDSARFNEAADALKQVLSDSTLEDAILLVFANKQDLVGASDSVDITESLNLKQYKDRKWYVQPCSAASGMGMFEGLNWLSRNLS